MILKLADRGGVAGSGEVVKASAGGGSRAGNRLSVPVKMSGTGVTFADEVWVGIEDDRESVFNPSVDADETTVVDTGLEATNDVDVDVEEYGDWVDDVGDESVRGPPNKIEDRGEEPPN